MVTDGSKKKKKLSLMHFDPVTRVHDRINGAQDTPFSNFFLADFIG